MDGAWNTSHNMVPGAGGMGNFFFKICYNNEVDDFVQLFTSVKFVCIYAMTCFFLLTCANI